MIAFGMGKPHINDVFEAFQTFQMAGLKATNQPTKMIAEYIAAKQDLRRKMEELGLDEHIDWSDWDDPAS
jgi:hypothetical protein